MTPAGTLTTIYSFCSQTNCGDGGLPLAGLVLATDGNFYGTTTNGGAYGYGTVFRITPRGTLSTLYSFCSQTNCTDGGIPTYALVQATDGNFYGITQRFGGSGDGVVFGITPGGTLTTLHSFDGTYGSVPIGGLVQATNGILYGSTLAGGANGDGTLFSAAEGLHPFVQTLPTSGKVGAQVKILGTNLTGATAVSFNGVAAVFKVISKTLISATVPVGATTGYVTVATPTGTLKSNVRFQVR